MKNTANIITGLRIVFSLAILFFPPFSPMFYILYGSAGLTDMIDGTVARKTNTVSASGEKLDTIADFIFVTVTEEELKSRKIIPTSFGEDLSWGYLIYVREHPVEWNVPTNILYGSRDNLTAYETISAFAEKHSANLTVMENGEHWFHTEEQMRFLDEWIKR